MHSGGLLTFSRIIELLVQLFFKQNKAFQANSKYAAWAHKDPESKSSREGSTPQSKASMDATSDKGTDKATKKRPRSEYDTFCTYWYISFANIVHRTVDNRLSPSSTFIDLSGSLASSPTLPWDHTLPTTRDIYDIPDEQVSGNTEFSSLVEAKHIQEPVNGHRSGSHNSTMPSKQNEAAYMGDNGPSKRRKAYGLRERTKQRFTDGLSDIEFEELMRSMQSETDSSDSDSPQSPRRAPVAPMMHSMEFESPEHQLPKHAESSTPSQTQGESAPKAKSSSNSSRMPPPPRALKKTTSPKQKNPKSHKVILKTSKGGVTSSTSSTSNSAPTTNYKQPSVEDITENTTSAISPTFQASHLPEDMYQAESVLGAASAAKKATPSSSHAPPTSSHGERKTQKSSSKAKNATPGEAPNAFISQRAGTENKLPTTSPTASLTATGSSSKTPARLPSTDHSTKQHPKPQTHINFFIISTQDDSSIVWPEGKFQGTSLSDFIAGVAKATQRDGIERLELTLKTSTSKTMAPVAKDDEAAWLVAKKHFGERLMAARAKAKAKGLDESANPKIYVEPFYGVVGDLGEVEEGNEEEEEDVSFLFD